MIHHFPPLDKQGQNPIRAHIRIEISSLQKKDEYIDFIAGKLGQYFHPNFSRVLVFVRTRKEAEQLCDNLKAHFDKHKSTVVASVLERARFASRAPKPVRKASRSRAVGLRYRSGRGSLAHPQGSHTGLPLLPLSPAHAPRPRKLKFVTPLRTTRLFDYLRDKVGYFHAGLSVEEREDAINDYKNGNMLIMCATKAFGMGMDIPNIHHLFHAGPSSTFEDFLQEVGRAGRGKKELKEARFSVQHPIRAYLLHTDKSFGDIQDLILQSQLPWAAVAQLFEEIKKLQKDLAINPFPLSNGFGYRTKIPAFIQDETNFRLALHWLEEAKRIELGYYVMAHLEFSTQPLQHNLSEHIADNQVKILYELMEEECHFIKNKTSNNQSPEFVSIGIARIMRALGLKMKESNELFKIIARGQKLSAIVLRQFIMLHKPNLKTYQQQFIAYLASGNPRPKDPVTQADVYHKLEVYFRIAEHILRGGNAPRWRQNVSKVLLKKAKRILPNTKTPKRRKNVLKLFLKIAERIFKGAKQQQWVQYNSSYLRPICKKYICQYFNSKYLIWIQDPATQNKVAIELQKNFYKKGRKGFARGLSVVFSILGMLRGVRQKNTIDKNTQEVYCDIWVEDSVDALGDLQKLKDDCYLVFKILYVQSKDEVFNVIDLLNQLQNKELTWLESVLYVLRRTALVDIRGSLIPTAIETELKDSTPIGAAAEDKNTEAAFEQTMRMRKLRLFVLWGFSELKDEKDQNNLINGYFACQNEADIILLLKKMLPSNSKVLRYLQEEAFTEALAKLNAEQMAVYDFDLDKQNLNVVAGPGSGKTHTLVLCAAKLIHKQAVRAENILVLAYNRAVKIEVRQRVLNLFLQLGYSRAAHSIQVHTFHSFMLHTLSRLPLTQQQRDDLAKPENIYPVFKQMWRNKRHALNALLSQFKYVFVDEFQDVNEERLDVLDILLESVGDLKIMVIGDPNQSIYGYSRKYISPTFYYNYFQTTFSPAILYLNKNYRSYPTILQRAQGFLKKNTETFGIGALQATKTPPPNWLKGYYFTSTNTLQWLDTLSQFCQEPNPEAGSHYAEIAVMFRTNVELFRGFGKIQNDARFAPNNNLRIRIQGESGDFLKIREVHYVLSQFIENRLTIPVPQKLVEEFGIFRSQHEQLLQNAQAKWELFFWDILEACFFQFEQETNANDTFQQLKEFLEDLAQKDDGQLMKLYQKHQSHLNKTAKTTIVLTTMHKVKGLEFDAVLLPPSYADLPIGNNGNHLFQDLIEEERRLRYVAITRAKYRFAEFIWQRESALDNGLQWSLQIETPRAVVKPNLQNVKLSWLAQQPTCTEFVYLCNEVQYGDEITIVAGGKIQHGGNSITIGSVSFQFQPRPNIQYPIHGLRISSIQAYTYQQCLDYDEAHNTTYAQNWQPWAINMGYIYVIEFSGYV